MLNDSIRIGRVFGITIRVHFLFLGMMGFLLISADVRMVLALLVLFGLVLLHELGHSLVARRFGIRVLDITFWPLGGMARMNEIPENTRVEALVAIAGPAVNFALAALALPVFFARGGADLLVSAVPGAEIDPVTSAIGGFIVMNLALGGFNLVPAFPMDGGRVLRALLGSRGDWVRATETAVQVGRVIAFAFLLAPLFRLSCLLPLIGLFIWWAGARELMAVRMRHGLGPFGLAGAGGTRFGPEALAELLRRQAEAANPNRPAPPAEDCDLDVPPKGDGFSEEDIEQLERFRGRLRRPPP